MENQHFLERRRDQNYARFNSYLQRRSLRVSSRRELSPFNRRTIHRYSSEGHLNVTHTIEEHIDEHIDANVDANEDNENMNDEFISFGMGDGAHSLPLQESPINARITDISNRLNELSIEMQNYSAATRVINETLTGFEQRYAHQQTENNRINAIVVNTDVQVRSLDSKIDAFILQQTDLCQRILNITTEQQNFSTDLNNRMTQQRHEIDRISQANATNDQNLNPLLANIRQSITRLEQAVHSLRNDGERDRQQLRTDWDAFRNNLELNRNRPAAVDVVHPGFANNNSPATSQMNDILKSIPDFDAKSSASIKKFITVTDILWNQVANNQADSERFRLKLKVKLAGCNQAFLAKIDALNWPRIKDEILKDFSINVARDTLAQINTVKQKSGESLFEYANRCKGLLHDMNSFLGGQADPGMLTIHDRSARKAFENGLSDSKLRDYISRVPSRNLQELIDTTIERYEHNLQFRSRESNCGYCSKTGHRENECRKKQADKSKNRDNKNNNNGSGRNSNQNGRDSNRNSGQNGTGSNRDSNQNGNRDRNSNQNNNSNRNSGQNGGNRNSNQSSTHSSTNGNTRGGNSNNFTRGQNNPNLQSYPTRVFENASISQAEPTAQSVFVPGTNTPNPYSHPGN
jgi:hypothetical protein